MKKDKAEKIKAKQEKTEEYKQFWERDNPKRIVMDILIGASVAIFLAYFFYRSIWATFPMGIIGYWFVQKKREDDIRKKKREFLLEFKECILSVQTSLQAGYAVENAFIESIHDINMIYENGSLMEKELHMIRRGIGINITLEELLIDLGRRSGQEEIIEFAEVFVIAKKNGGSIPDIIHSTCELIKSKIDTENEIHTFLSAKRMEQKVMNVMPFVILLYIQVVNQGYFDKLYHNITGQLIMSGCLLVYLIAYVLSDKIMEMIIENS